MYFCILIIAEPENSIQENSEPSIKAEEASEANGTFKAFPSSTILKLFVQITCMIYINTQFLHFLIEE